MIFSQYYLIYFFKNLNLINYHFIFSLAGEMTSKLKTYQYLHHPFYSLNPNHYLAVGLNWKKFHKIFIRFIFTIFIRFLLNIKKNSFQKVITFTNSSWSKKRIKNIYRINKIKIIYPTFNMPKYFISNNNFEKRNDDFVILGRISDDKNIVEGIKFFQKIKNRFKKTKMHLIGPIDNKYKKKLNNLLLDKDIILHGYLDKKNRNSILKKSKFGLHFFKYEHFGRSVLEMQKFGMIVFVHKSGGVESIVFSNVQKYTNLKDLEINFCKVLNNEKLRNCILKLNKNKLSNQYTSNSFYKSLYNNLLH
jgi:glycosyltransferase involved in cell wall biosynthesis